MVAINRSIPSCTIFYSIGMIIYFFFGGLTVFWGDFFWCCWCGYTVSLLINESRLPIDRLFKNFGLLLFGTVWAWYMILPFFGKQFSHDSTYVMGGIYGLILIIMLIFGLRKT